MKVDRLSADVSIPWEHHKVHMGEMFALTDEVASVAIVTPLNYLFKVGSGDPVHFNVGVAATAGFKAELFEGTTVSADGTTLAAQLVNMNRVFGNPTLNMTWFRTPTVTGDGTRIGITRAGGSSHPQSPGGAARPDLEFNLKPSTNYMLRITVVADGTTVTTGAAAYED